MLQAAYSINIHIHITWYSRFTNWILWATLWSTATNWHAFWRVRCA